MTLTTILAIYGSVLGTAVLIWDIIKYKGDKVCLKIEAGHHILGDARGRP
jgi:hypothetical protein